MLRNFRNPFSFLNLIPSTQKIMNLIRRRLYSLCWKKSSGFQSSPVVQTCIHHLSDSEAAPKNPMYLRVVSCNIQLRFVIWSSSSVSKYWQRFVQLFDDRTIQKSAITPLLSFLLREIDLNLEKIEDEPPVNKIEKFSEGYTERICSLSSYLWKVSIWHISTQLFIKKIPSTF